MFKKIFVIMVATWLVGCAGSGSIDWNNARKLEADMPKQKVVELMGQPYSVVTRNNGQQTYVWVHVNGFTGSSASMALNFMDDKLMAKPNVPDSY